jgi:hypothetical protein
MSLFRQNISPKALVSNSEDHDLITAGLRRKSEGITHAKWQSPIKNFINTDLTVGIRIT